MNTQEIEDNLGQFESGVFPLLNLGNPVTSHIITSCSIKRHIKISAKSVNNQSKGNHDNHFHNSSISILSLGRVP